MRVRRRTINKASQHGNADRAGEKIPGRKRAERPQSKEVDLRGRTVQTTMRSIGTIPFAMAAESCGAAFFCCWPESSSFARLSGRRSRQLFKQTYPLPPGGSFLLENVNGSVQVDGWERDEVEVSAVKTSQSDQHDVELVKIEVDSTPARSRCIRAIRKGKARKWRWNITCTCRIESCSEAWKR